MKHHGGSQMTREAAARIQAAACKNNGGTTPANSFASRAMSAAYKNEPSTSSQSAGSVKSTNQPKPK